jgi:hypothetical protein
MKTEITLRLINGRFDAPEAQPILTEMVNAKLQHHDRKMARHATTEEDVKSSETRIKILEGELREVLKFLREVEQRGGRVDIEGTLVLREV